MHSLWARLHLITFHLWRVLCWNYFLPVPSEIWKHKKLMWRSFTFPCCWNTHTMTEKRGTFDEIGQRQEWRSHRAKCWYLWSWPNPCHWLCGKLLTSYWFPCTLLVFCCLNASHFFPSLLLLGEFKQMHRLLNPLVGLFVCLRVPGYVKSHPSKSMFLLRRQAMSDEQQRQIVLTFKLQQSAANYNVRKIT